MSYLIHVKKSISLSETTYIRLFKRASSFEDTAEDVIIGLLDAVEGETTASINSRRRVTRAAPGSILPEGEYWRPILSIIDSAGGSARANDVIDALEDRLGDRFTEKDREPLAMGEIRWRNRARFARLRMIERGLLSGDAPRGRWEITDEGRAYLAKLRDVERSA